LADEEPLDGGLCCIQKQGYRFPQLQNLCTFVKRIDNSGPHYLDAGPGLGL